MKKIMKIICLPILAGILIICLSNSTYAAGPDTLDTGGLTGETTTRTNIEEPGASESEEELGELNIANAITISVGGDNGSVSGTLRVLVILTLLSIIPLLLIMLTSFTRILIVLHFTRAALSTQTAPPNQVLIGLAVFLTIFIMRPTFNTVYTEAIVPFDRGEITQEEFVDKAITPFREFMYPQTYTKNVRTFLEISGDEWDGTLEGLPTEVLVASFIVSELTRSFIIGFLIYIPFIVIDMVVASSLMSMGMMMLPPTTISMPFKILLFVLADGWNLIIVNLVKTFY
ncbi:MAG: flagellar type III secretion system pore protein FliP [Lachnospiraceae bacterium]|nr:flagellar type III secretion system pore protein FliP [Lachnospiraceae bacterium]